MRLLNHLYAPVRCSVCDRELSPLSPPLCEGCEKILERARIDPAERCGVCCSPLAKEGACPVCSERNLFFDRHLSLFTLTDHWHVLLKHWKFSGERSLFRVFEEPLARALRELDPERGAGRLRTGYAGSGRSLFDHRNYQPCRDLARHVSSLLSCSMGEDLRKRARFRQSGRRYGMRFSGIHDALECRLPRIPAADTYILLEDLFTTGATSNEGARVLKKNGVKRVLLISMLMNEGAAVRSDETVRGS